MSLDLAHKNLGWPSPEEVRNPQGEGARIFAELARAKIERAISSYPNAQSVKVGVLSRNSQAAITEAPLAIVAEFTGKATDQTLRELHRLAWNFSHSPTIVTIEPDLLRVWTCCEPPDENRLLDDYIVHKLSTADLTEPHSSDITIRATQLLHWINLVSGQFFRDHAQRFHRDRRADQMLLGNLRYVRQKLHEKGLTNDDVCHDLLARIVFVQFLFDRKDSKGNSALNRGKLISLREAGILKKEHSDFSSILGDYEETYRLFDWLNSKFNGDLFPGKGNTPQEREQGWQEERRHVKPAHLCLLRDFIRGDLDMPKGQLCLWQQYAFDAIPLEFISSIYETFVTERASAEGIYYTPPHLVDFILDRVLPWDGKDWNLKVLDPSCGSGVFLVKAFQRLIHRWRKAHPGQAIRAETLRALLERNLFGVDKDPHAVRVASFSIYLAMCDEIDPKYYWTQVTFPAMREHQLINADFFEENRPGFRTKEDAATYDLMIGNAPWGERLLTEAASQWAKDEAHRWPVVNKGIGTLFLPKAAALTKPDGKIAMIQSASSLLFNRSGPACEFRQKFFGTFDVDEVVNLSALRFKIFNRRSHSIRTSVAPSCVVVFKPKPPSNQQFVYVSPKQVEAMADEFDIFVEPIDVKAIYPVDAVNDPEVWTILMWGNQRDRALIQRLRHLSSIEKNVLPDGTRRGIELGDRRQARPELAGRRILRQPDFPPGDLFSLRDVDLPTFDDPHIHSKDSTDFSAFSLPQLIIKRSWRKPLGRFQARVVDASEKAGVLCTQSYVTVHLPVERMEEIEAACLSYNSILAVYFLLLTSSRFASYRPEPLVEELLRVPIPAPYPRLLERLQSVEDIDQRVREAFNFRDAEWALVEDLFNITLPDFKGETDWPGRKRTQRQTDLMEEPELRHYCEYFIRVLKAGFGQDKQITATVFHEISENLLPYRLVAFELNKPSDKQFCIKPLDTLALLSELEALNQTWLRSRTTTGGSIYHQRVARIYHSPGVTPTIFIIKPDACRYWTRSMGLYDADEVSADFSRWRSATRAD